MSNGPPNPRARLYAHQPQMTAPFYPQQQQARNYAIPYAVPMNQQPFQRFPVPYNFTPQAPALYVPPPTLPQTFKPNVDQKPPIQPVAKKKSKPLVIRNPKTKEEVKLDADSDEFKPSQAITPPNKLAITPKQSKALQIKPKANPKDDQAKSNDEESTTASTSTSTDTGVSAKETEFAKEQEKQNISPPEEKEIPVSEPVPQPQEIKDGSDSNTTTTEQQQLQQEKVEEEEKEDLGIYTKDQWSPTNPNGCKSYTKDFMVQFRHACSAKPEGLQSPKFSTASEGPSRSSSYNSTFGGKFGSGRSSGSHNNRGNYHNRGNAHHDNNNNNNRGFGGNRNQPRAAIHLPREKTKLEPSANSWVVNMKKAKGPLTEAKALLNKLTLEKFDKLSKNILDLLSHDLDALLEPFTEMLFVKAVDEHFFSMVYSKLCRYLSDEITRKNGTEKPKEDEKPVNFKRVLLNQCQKQFEAASSAAAAQEELEKKKKIEKNAEEIAKEEAKIKAMGNKERTEYEKAKREEAREAELLVAKTKRHVVGNIVFIGELYKLDMVPDKIMYYCIDHLFTNAKDDGLEPNLEQLCKLLDTAGEKLEKRTKLKRKNKAESKQVQEYWEDVFKKLTVFRMQKGVDSRIRFAIQDVLDLRKRNWVARVQNKGPKTIAEIHKKAKEEQLTIKMENSGPPPGRGSRDKRQPRNSYSNRNNNNNSGWDKVNKSTKVDSTKFVGLNKMKTMQQVSLGKPSISLGHRKNFFNVLSSGDDNASSKSNSRTSLKPSSTKSSSTPPTPVGKEPDEKLTRKIDGCIKEYLSIHDMNEVSLSLNEWAKEYNKSKAHSKFVTKILDLALEVKEGDRNNLYKLVKSVVGEHIDVSDFVSAVTSYFETLADMMIDVPKADEYLGEIIAAGIVADAKAIDVFSPLTTKETKEILYGDAPLKLVLQSLRALKALSGESAVNNVVSKFSFKLSDLIPEARSGGPDEERVAELCDRSSMSFILNPSAGGGFGEHIIELIREKSSCDALIKHIDTVPDSKSPIIISQLTTAILSAVTSATTMKDSSKGKPSQKQEDEEKELVNTYSLALRKLCDENDTLQLHVLCSIQTFAHKKTQPPGLVNRWFEYMYDTDVVEEKVFKNYRNDSSISKSSPYEGKNQAVELAKELYMRLDQPEEADDERA